MGSQPNALICPQQSSPLPAALSWSTSQSQAPGSPVLQMRLVRPGQQQQQRAQILPCAHCCDPPALSACSCMHIGAARQLLQPQLQGTVPPDGMGGVSGSRAAQPLKHQLGLGSQWVGAGYTATQALAGRGGVIGWGRGCTATVQISWEVGVSWLQQGCTASAGRVGGCGWASAAQPQLVSVVGRGLRSFQELHSHCPNQLRRGGSRWVSTAQPQLMSAMEGESASVGRAAQPLSSSAGKRDLRLGQLCTATARASHGGGICKCRQRAAQPLFQSAGKVDAVGGGRAAEPSHASLQSSLSQPKAYCRL